MFAVGDRVKFAFDGTGNPESELLAYTGRTGTVMMVHTYSTAYVVSLDDLALDILAFASELEAV